MSPPPSCVSSSAGIGLRPWKPPAEEMEQTKVPVGGSCLDRWRVPMQAAIDRVMQTYGPRKSYSGARAGCARESLKFLASTDTDDENKLAVAGLRYLRACPPERVEKFEIGRRPGQRPSNLDLCSSSRCSLRPARSRPPGDLKRGRNLRVASSRAVRYGAPAGRTGNRFFH
jgi:hypothetical protein